MRMLWLSFAQAWTFLTILPMPGYLSTTANRQTSWATSIFFYPLIGGLLASILLLLSVLLPGHWHPLIQAAIILTGWVVLTGALHLDGLADSADGLFALHKNPARLHQVLKDSHVGPIAVVAILMLLILKLVLLAGLIETQFLSSALIASLVGARWSVLTLMLTTDYVGQSHPNRRPYGPLGGYFGWVTGVLILVFLILFKLPLVLLLAALTLLILYCWRAIWRRAVGGYVGDALGALIEITEVILLLCVYGYSQ